MKVAAWDWLISGDEVEEGQASRKRGSRESLASLKG